MKNVIEVNNLIKKLEMLDYGIDCRYFTTRDCFDKLFKKE